MATITKRESGRFQTRVRRGRDGAVVSRTFANVADANAWGRKIENEVERGVWRDTSQADRTTFAECLDRYIADYVPKLADPARARSQVLAVRRMPLAKLTMNCVRSANVAGVRDAWAKIGHRPATIIQRLAVISRVFNIARTEWGMETLANPVATVSKPRADNARDRRVSDDEIAALAEASASAELATIIRLAVETAMRRSELVGLQWEHVDLGRCTAHLPKTKNGHARTVPLSSRAVALLRGLPRRPDGRVFAMRPDSVTQAFERACERARIDGLHFHDLRHEATSRLADFLQAHELAKVTGHRDMRMLLRYYHPRAEDLARKIG